MATTLPPHVEAEFVRLWSHTPTTVPLIREWLADTHGIRVDVGALASRMGIHRQGATHQAARDERTALTRLNAPTRPPDNQVRKPTPEQRAACRVPPGGYRMGRVAPHRDMPVPAIAMALKTASGV